MRRIAILAIVSAAFLTSACTGSDFEAFDREQSDADVLPPEALSIAGVQPDSTRFMTEESGVSYYLASSQQDGKDLTCIVAFESARPEAAHAGCTTKGGYLTMSGDPLGHSVQLVPDDLNVEREGWRQLAPNLYVSE